MPPEQEEKPAYVSRPRKCKAKAAPPDATMLPRKKKVRHVTTSTSVAWDKAWGSQTAALGVATSMSKTSLSASSSTKPPDQTEKPAYVPRPRKCKAKAAPAATAPPKKKVQAKAWGVQNVAPGVASMSSEWTDVALGVASMKASSATQLWKLKVKQIPGDFLKHQSKVNEDYKKQIQDKKPAYVSRSRKCKLKAPPVAAAPPKKNSSVKTWDSHKTWESQKAWGDQKAALGVAKMPPSSKGFSSVMQEKDAYSAMWAKRTALLETRMQKMQAKLAEFKKIESLSTQPMLQQVSDEITKIGVMIADLKKKLNVASYKLNKVSKKKYPPPVIPTTPYYSPYNYRNTDQGAQKKLVAGRKEALEKEHKRDEENVAYLNGMNKTLLESEDEPTVAATKKLVGVIVELFRNQVPTEWSSRSALYNTALDVCRTMASKTELAILFGTSSTEDENDRSNTIIASLTEFSQHAEMIVKRSSSFGSSDDDNGDSDLLFATNVLQVKELVEKAFAQHETKRDDRLAAMSRHDNYRAELGPLRFDIVDTLHKHYFLRDDKSAPVSLDVRRVFKELTAYRTSLPVEYGSSIFVRAVNNRLDMLRALVIGPENTPYANGCFFFDINLTDKYPSGPPQVQFMTTGGGHVRFNPNLYKCGKVCLSLLGTWSGPGWVSGTSTLLQVLISIQSLILVPDPYFNEPGYERSRGTPQGDARSESYNKNLRLQTATHCIEHFLSQLANDDNKKDYPEFSDVIRKHFFAKKRSIEQQLKEWARLDPAHLSNKSAKICSMLDSLARSQRAAMRSKTRASQEASTVDELLDTDISRAETSSACTSHPIAIDLNSSGSISDDDRKLPAKRIETAPSKAQAVGLAN